MNATEALWKENLQGFGGFIRAQRQFTDCHNGSRPRWPTFPDTYMSQLEGGLHEPSIRVLRAVADSLGINASQLIMYAAGLPVEDDDITADEAIRRDPRFTDAQRRTLLGVVKSYLESNDT